MQVRDALVCVSARCDELLSLSWLFSYVFPLWERTACRVCAFVSARRRVPRVSVCEKQVRKNTGTFPQWEQTTTSLCHPSLTEKKQTWPLTAAEATSLYGAASFPGTGPSWKIFTLGCSRHKHTRACTHTPTQTCLISFHPLILLLILVCASEDPLRGNMLPLLNLAHNHNQTHALNYWDSL